MTAVAAASLTAMAALEKKPVLISKNQLMFNVRPEPFSSGFS